MGDVAVDRVQRIELPRGRLLVVRPVRIDDVDALAELYAGLTDDDLHSRFFSVFRPDRDFLVMEGTVEERGGCGLVAVVSDRAGADDDRLVAIATCALLADGDGELAITVARDWRGWLGSLLLDALLDAAAAHGIPNLEAQVLATNRSMLALARSRGAATMPSDDWVSLRLLVGTTGRTPTWPPRDGRPRVLVEVPGGRWLAATEAEAAGLQVLCCSGPRPGRPRCPVLDGEPCPLAAEADAVVTVHLPDTEDWRAVLAGHDVLHPGVPVCTATTGEETVRALVERLQPESSREGGT